MAFQPYGNILGGVYLIDSGGNALPLINNAGSPQICAQSYLQALAEGDISGHTPWSKIGFLGTTSANINNDIWARGGTYVYASTAGVQMMVNSSAGSDTSNGTGIQKVNLYYLDSNYAEQVEEITLAGTNTVPTVATNIIRVQGFRASACGTSGSAAGTVSIMQYGATTTTYSVIASTYTRARNITYTVPAGKSLYITSIKFGIASGSKQCVGRFINRAKYDEKVGVHRDFFMAFTEMVLQDTSITFELEIPTKLPEKTDLKVSVIPDQDGAQVVTALRGWLE